MDDLGVPPFQETSMSLPLIFWGRTSRLSYSPALRGRSLKYDPSLSEIRVPLNPPVGHYIFPLSWSQFFGVAVFPFLDTATC